jgi:SIR2-like domain
MTSAADGPQILLFGAGASKDAGLPDSFELTDRVLDAIKDSPEAKVLAFAVGGILFGGGVRGLNPRSRGADIEALIRAVDRLDRRQESDVAPFVSAWHPHLLELERMKPSRPRLAADPPLSVFGAAREESMRVLRRILWTSDSPFSYLAPIASILTRQRRLVIGTLNYDNIVERFCRAFAIPYSTGIPERSNYDPRVGYVQESITEGISLLKLHGSLNWSMHTPPPRRGPGLVEHPFVLTWGDKAPNFADIRLALPGILFGGQNKLTADGPFLDLLFLFRAELLAAEHLTIVGYSFRDHHINAQLVDFANRSEQRSIVVIDPNPPIESPVLSGLRDGLGTRLKFVRLPAAAGLIEVFASR